MTNSIEVYEKLKSAMPDAQAGAVVQAIEMAVEGTDSDHSNRLANKVDQAKFDSEMHQLEANLNSSIAALTARIDEKIAECIARTDEKIAIHAARTDAKIAESKAETIRWMFIFWIGQIAAIKFLR
jgi:hypothetical protein